MIDVTVKVCKSGVNLQDFTIKIRVDYNTPGPDIFQTNFTSWDENSDPGGMQTGVSSIHVSQRILFLGPIIGILSHAQNHPNALGLSRLT